MASRTTNRGPGRAARTAAAAAALGALALGSPAQAIDCPFARDAAGDGVPVVLGNGAPSTAAMDLIALDIASGRNTVVVRIQLAGLEANATDLHDGVVYAAQFEIDDSAYTAVLERMRSGSRAYFVRDRAVDPVPPAVAVDTRFGTITWTIERSRVEALDPRDVFYNIFASTMPSFAGVRTNADVLSTERTYVDRTEGCVAAA